MLMRRENQKERERTWKSSKCICKCIYDAWNFLLSAFN